MRRPLLLLCLALAACSGASGGLSGAPGGVTDDDAGVPAPAADAGARAEASTGGDADVGPEASPTPTDRIKTVFLIMMENHSWSTISGSSRAQYIDDKLVKLGGHAENYFTPPGNHPSLRNYIWLEAGDNLGITTDDEPSVNHQSTTDHLSAKLTAANVPWRAYVEDISGTECPLVASGKFVPRHTPQLYFDDVTNTNDATAQGCIQHVRPYGELVTDLQKNTVARYNLITPNLCDDMHGLTFSCTTDNFNEIGAGDTWLATEVPKIMASDAYKDNGVIFVLWDEGDESLVSEASDGPIPLLVLSPKAKPGYASTTKFTHSSMLKTLQEIFGVQPFLRDAASATDLSEFFTSFP
jgi:phospholipase C